MDEVIESSDEKSGGATPAPPAKPQAKRAAEAAPQDFSNEIERTIEKEPFDRVRCIRVFEQFYRCNWWAPAMGPAQKNQGFDWAVATTHHVRKSRFLKASISGGRLVLAEVVARQT